MSKDEHRELREQMEDIQRRIYMVQMPLKKRQRELLYKAAVEVLNGNT